MSSDYHKFGNQTQGPDVTSGRLEEMVERDIRIEWYRVGSIASFVRATHIPTGVTVGPDDIKGPPTKAAVLSALNHKIVAK